MAERRYTKNGEWIRRDGELWRVGLSTSAVEELGDVTFVEAPTKGRVVEAGEAACAVEAVKAAADFYSPVKGRIAVINPRLAAEPQLLNQSPEEEGWILALDSVNEDEVKNLLDEQAWKLWEEGR